MSLIGIVKNTINNDGPFIFFLKIVKVIVNKIYTFLIFQRDDIYVDYTSKIKGKNHIKIGNNFYAGKLLWLEAIKSYEGITYFPKILIKDNVNLQDFVHIGAVNYIEIGNNVLFASRVYVTDHNHGIYRGNSQSNPDQPPLKRNIFNNESVIISDNVWVGENVIILPGVTIGKGSIIGSNSVVTNDVPPNSIVVGVPGKVIKSFNYSTNTWEKK